jgi:mannose-6-phosphate isomerase-like protein (cupin superfamily)
LIFIQDLKDGIYFQAGDQSLLCELLHPDRLGVPLQMGFSLAHAKIKPGQSTLTHKLSTSSEIYYILDGEGVIHIEQESAPIHPGQVIYIPPNSKQYIQNTGYLDLTFLCMVYPQWKKEDEVIYL